MASAAVEDGETIREIHLKVDTRFAMIVVVPKVDETKDANFPRNLHNAAELFLRVGMVPAAEQLRSSTATMLDLYSDHPDGKTGVQVGQACVCWSCGFVGLPNEPQDEPSTSAAMKKKVDVTTSPPGPCGTCGETTQINWVRVMSHTTKEEIPWIQEASMTPGEKAKKVAAEKAAKRAEIEANVAAALADRSTTTQPPS